MAGFGKWGGDLYGFEGRGRVGGSQKIFGGWGGGGGRGAQNIARNLTIRIIGTVETTNQRRKQMVNEALNMSESELYDAAYNMERIGGGFATAIARAFYVADSDNRRLILKTFGHLFVKHSPADIWN